MTNNRSLLAGAPQVLVVLSAFFIEKTCVGGHFMKKTGAVWPFLRCIDGTGPPYEVHRRAVQGPSVWIAKSRTGLGNPRW